ncbi:N-acetylmuramoyl-L-alanine amidase [Yoonia sp. SS1-5]|uniref:N-acetylmuramoyl-L-alanine amidase n=1 Tax=Yoonia rhodophyticola TaxID=3137370 RepID=A0AAN0NJX0_9RHOB
MIRAFVFWLVISSAAQAQARLDVSNSQIADGWWSLEIALTLDTHVPYRIFTLDDPRRLIIDFEGLDQASGPATDLLTPGRAISATFTAPQEGWTRLSIALSEPLAIEQASMQAVAGQVALNVSLSRVSAGAFAAAAGAPEGVVLPETQPDMVTAQPDAAFVVVIDPGHGGLDPGAERAGLQEAPLMLDLAREVAHGINQRPGLQAVMTRDSDVFVPLAARVSMARAAGADLLISLHADALAEDAAQGVSVYTLAQGGGDRAARRMVERHEGGDLLDGLDLRGQGDGVATVLMDLARQQTGPAGQELAATLVAAMERQGVRLNARPLREGQLAVLSAADFPSLLIEAGFLSNAQDRAQLVSAQSRAPLVAALVEGIAIWAATQQGGSEN